MTFMTTHFKKLTTENNFLSRLLSEVTVISCSFYVNV